MHTDPARADPWPVPPLLPGGRDMVARVQDEYGKLDILVNK